MKPFLSNFFKNSFHFLLSKPFALLLGLILMLSVGQAWGQTITNVSVTKASIPVTQACAGSTVDLSFLVTNGTNGNRFQTTTVYYVFLNSTQITSFTSTTQPGNSTGAFLTISRTVTIPPATVSGSNYSIQVRTLAEPPGTVTSTLSNAFTVGSLVSITSASTSVCLGGSTTLSGNVTAYGSWTITLSTGETVTGTGSGTWNKLVTPSVTTTYTISSFTDAGCTTTASTTGSSTITVNALTNIIAHPSTSSQNYCQNDAATALFISTNVTASSYEWYSNGSPSNSGGTLIPSAITNSYTPSTTTPGTVYYYSIVYAPCGNQTSNVSGAITVNSSPTITAQPASSIPLICAVNDPAPSLSVSASASSGSITQYEWYSNTTATNSGGALVQTNSSSSTTDNFTPSSSSAGTLYYYCVVTNSNGCTQKSSVSGAVTVTLSIITQPVASQTVVAGSAASFSVVAPASGTTYQWKKDGNPIAGATSSTYNIPSVSASDAATYTVEVTNSTCTPPVTSDPSVLIVVVAQPTTQASNIVFTPTASILPTSLTLTWTNGNGARRIIVGRAGAAVNHDPVDGTDYTASAVFGSGSETSAATGNYVVYNNNTPGPITITGLLPSTNYYFRVYEYNGTGTSANYYTVTATQNPNNQSTRPSTPASGINFTNVSHNSVTVNWTSGDGANRIVVARPGGTATNPADGSVYTANAAYGSGSLIGAAGRVVYNGSGNSVTVTNLNPATSYSFDIYGYAGSSTGATDKTVYLTPGTTGSQTTNPTPANSSNITFPSITATTMQLSWTSGTGTNRLVVAHAGSPVNADPVTGTTVYTANATFGSGTQIGTGNYVVYKGNSNTVTVTGLTTNVNYYFKIYDYTTGGSTNTYNFTSTTNNPNNQTTRPSLQTTLAATPFPADSASSLQINWVNGNGARRIVVIHEGAAVDSNPVDGVSFTANALYGSGTEIGTGNYVVYDGTGTTVTVTGLNDATTYYFRFYEYNGTNASPSTTDKKVYLTSASASDPIFRTTPARRDYRTQNSGVWTDLSIWQTYDVKTGSWPPATKLPFKNSAVTISAGNVVTINITVALDQLTIDGTLIVSNTGSLTIEANTRNSYNQAIGSSGKLDVFGTLTIDNKADSEGHSPTNTHFYAGSTYNHESRQTEGIVPLATWDSGSTISVNGYNGSMTATAGGNWGQTFSNVIFNCALGAGTSVDMNGFLNSINGNLSVTNSGSGQITLNGVATAPTITIGGNINLSGASILALNTIGTSTIIIGDSGTGSINVAGTSRLIVNTTGSPTLTIPNDLNITSTNATGSSFNTSGSPIIDIDGSITVSGAGGLLSFGSGVSAGSATVNLKTNFLFTAGTVSNASTNAANFGQVNFIGGGIHTFSNPGTMSGKIHFTVASANILDVGTSAIMGTGNFTLSANATLRVGSTHANGALQLAPAVGGNLQNTGTRTFGSPSTIEFNSNAAQFIGNGFPSTATVHLINNNTSPSGLTATAAITLTLAGDFTNNGVFNHNNATVAFAATTNIKEIKGSVKVTFNNLTINGGVSTAAPDVRLENTAGADLRGVLNVTTNTESTFDADGVGDNRVFTLLSTGDSPTVDASVAPMNVAGGQVQGKVTVQRYMSKEPIANPNIFRYISSPVQNGSVADIQGEIQVRGSFTGSNGSGQSMYRYSEPVQGNRDRGYVDFPVNTNAETLTPGVGYVFLVRGSSIAGTNTRWDISGPINSGTIPITVSKSGTTNEDGWNLVGNPFAATINWNAASGWQKPASLDGAIYTTDNGAGNELIQYAYYVDGDSINGGSRFIASGQAFWVFDNTVGSHSLIINESAKAAGTQTTFFRKAGPKDVLRITLVKGQSRDETVLRFKESSTSKFDGHSDAYKMINGGLNLCSITEANEFLAINSMPSFDCNHTIKLSFWNVPAGTYKLDFSQYESFPEAVSIILKDNFTKTEVDVRNTPSYEFTVTSDANSLGNNRFTVNFSAASINTEFTASATDICAGNDAQLIIAGSSSAVKYYVMLEDGTEVTSATGNDVDLTLTIPAEKLIAGQNTFTIKSVNAYCSTSTYEQTVTFLVDAIPGLPVVEDTKRCQEGVVTLVATGSPSKIYNWYEDEADVDPIPAEHSWTFTTLSLSKTKTYYVSSVNSLGCEGPRAQVKAIVVLYDDVVITRQPPDLVSSYETGNQWYLNGVLIPGAVDQTYKPKGPGMYKVEVLIDGCSTSDEIDFLTITQGPHHNDEEFSTFPNPFESTLKIMLANPNNLDVRITMTDMKGMQLIDQTSGASEDGIYTVNTDQLPTGVYTLHVKFGSSVRVRKVLKE
ncbi:MAG TPA: T9SS type A sorting domain-containing protein [Chryseolinea sp.]|nr:T9SS type A sorting domain-containing protein [Chryseolinea sp.]